MIKACIFDLDGTLADTLESMAAAANAVMDKLGLAHVKVDDFRYYSGEGADMLVKRCLKDAGDPHLKHYDKARNLYRKIFNENPYYHVRPYPGIMETIHALKREGLYLGVCSNKPHEAAEKLIQMLFGSQIDLVIGQQPEVRRKPDPDGPLRICQAFGVKPEECLYIGDTGTDMQTGKAAGMYTVGVLWGFRDQEELRKNGADILCETPEDLLDIYEDYEND